MQSAQRLREERIRVWLPEELDAHSAAVDALRRDATWK